ncbi:MAG: hypothetical protein ACERKN_07170 [Velocimicrobium sp.]
MKVKKVIVDVKIKDCSLCPLAREYKKDCGKQTVTNDNGGVKYGKIPNSKCKLKIQD